ncbi:hypothetical protein [Actinoplanes sp. NPDC051859]|uniref:hypothetical protein n=1 Tax=Actinoplanes sp. NPDC051859 TaxID=3363909 RepID=UPI0037BA3800
MNFRDVIREKLGAAGTVSEAIGSFRAAHGRRASRELADKFGVSMRTAQKWLKGDQAPASTRSEQVRRGAEHGRLAADSLRNAQALTIGDIEVEYDGKPQGKRKVGTVHVDGNLRTALDEVADLIEMGSLDEAEQLYSDAILGAYSGQRAKDDRRILGGTLKIRDHGSGPDII